MHELSVCQSMLTQVTAIARQHAATGVSRITLRIGPLSGVESRLLQDAFPLARAGTVAERAELNIETLPIRIRCRQCERESEAKINRLICAHCGGYQTQVTSGDELLLANVELELH